MSLLLLWDSKRMGMNCLLVLPRWGSCNSRRYCICGSSAWGFGKRCGDIRHTIPLSNDLHLLS